MQKLLLFVLSVFLITSCGDDDPLLPTGNPTSLPNTNWLIDQSLVFDGGPGKDGIPSVDTPNFTTASEVTYLSGNDLILGLRVGDEIRAYPHPILDWHEIVNDEISDLKFALTYCPLTGTGIGWDRVLDGEETTFGVSGLLFDSNLMPYDRATNSTWSQQRLECVNGANIGKNPKTVSLIETRWSVWKDAYPDSKVLNTETGFGRNYRQYPYGDFRTNNERLLFPVTNLDNRLPSKERVLGVLDGDDAIAFQFVTSIDGPIIQVEKLNRKNIIVLNDGGRDIIVAFEVIDPTDYKVVTGDFPFVIEDKTGERFDILDFNKDGSQHLSKPTQFIGYWFSWGTFYPEIKIYK